MTLSSPLFFIQVKVNPGATRGALPYQSPLLNILLLLLRLSFNEQQPGHRQTGYRRHWDTFNLQTLPSPPLHSTRSNCLPGFARLLFFTELDLFLMKRWPRVVERSNCRTCETQPAPVTTVFFFCLWGINQEPVTCLLPLVPLGICIVKRKTKEAAAHWWSADAFFFRGASSGQMFIWSLCFFVAVSNSSRVQIPKRHFNMYTTEPVYPSLELLALCAWQIQTLDFQPSSIY